SLLKSTDWNEQNAWLEERTDELLTHLGLVHHRILTAGNARITVEQYDVAYRPGAPRRVTPLDPSGTSGGGTAGLPAELRLEPPEGRAGLTADAWPASETGKAGYVLDGRGPLDSQGLYVYRRNRLLQAGG